MPGAQVLKVIQQTEKGSVFSSFPSRDGPKIYMHVATSQIIYHDVNFLSNNLQRKHEGCQLDLTI